MSANQDTPSPGSSGQAPSSGPGDIAPLARAADHHDALYEGDARALAESFELAFRDLAQWSRLTQGIVQTARDRHDARTGQLALGYEALALTVVKGRRTPGTPERVNEIVAQLQQAGATRALRLAEAAWVLIEYMKPEQGPALLARLEAHGEAAHDERLGAERFWTVLAIVNLHLSMRNFSEALKYAIQLEVLAADSGLMVLKVLAHDSLLPIFLSTGDMGGALAVLPQVRILLENLGWQRVVVCYNVMLTLVLADQFDEAFAFLNNQAWLLDKDFLKQHDPMCSMVASIWARNGLAADAVALIGSQPVWVEGEGHVITANRAWLNASVWIAAGDPQRAVERIEGFLATAAADESSMSPMNATQVFRVFSEALEATGDFRRSLHAIKKSQASCFNWLDQSMQARLSALQLAAPEGDQSMQRRRASAVSEAVIAAKTEAASQPATDAGRYFAGVTHEMRSPLQSILAMTSLLMRTDLDERQRRQLKLTHSSAKMLLALCNDVLDLAKIEAGKFELRLAAVDVADSLHESVQWLEPLVDSSAVLLRHEVDTRLNGQEFLCDRLRLQQVTMNLLSNAIKFTHSGSITLRAVWQTPTIADPQANAVDVRCDLMVEVIDTGPGLSPEEQKRVFEEFVQLDAEQSHSQRGTGLGLTLSRRLVELMGGRLQVHSETGKGSRFWFTIPLKPCATK